MPANEASWDEMQTVFGRRGEAARCQCQWFRIPAAEWRATVVEERRWRHREQVGCDDRAAGDLGEADLSRSAGQAAEASSDARDLGLSRSAGQITETGSGGRDPGQTSESDLSSLAGQTSGLIAYFDDEPAGWCAIAPRTEYPHLRTAKVPWAGRTEDKDDPGIWAVTCFVTRTGFRRRGISRALAAASVDFARERGARALEAYPMIVKPGEEMSWGELYVGDRNSFVAAGFNEVSRPTVRRVVMRVEF